MSTTYIEHHGILGQKWGVRRYQNPDGSLTSAGKLRYDQSEDGKYHKVTKEERNKRIDDKRTSIRFELSKKLESEYDESEEGKAYKKWRKSHPTADADDFGDYLADHHEIPSFETKQREISRDVRSLDKNHAKSIAIGASLVSTLYLAPVTALIAGKSTGSGEAAAIAALSVIGLMTVTSYASAKKDHINAEKKYGLR